MKKNNPNEKSSADGKLHISKSVFETSREMQEKAVEEERQRQAERERVLAERRKKAEEARAKRLEAERIELIRLKQGVIEESELIAEEHEEAVERTPWQKITDFFYHNKWWLGFGIFLAILGVYLVYSLATRERPDVIVLVIGENYTLAEESSLRDYISGLTPDINENGENLASVYYIPYTGDQQKDYVNGVPERLTAETQSANAVIVFGNAKADEDVFDEDGIFTDLTKLYPDNPHVSGERFMLADTGLAEKIGIDRSCISDDWYIAIREPVRLMYDSEAKMQKRYDSDFVVFDAIVRDLS